MPRSLASERARGPAHRLNLRALARPIADSLGSFPSHDLADAAIDTWHARMINEHGSAHVFSALARQLRDVGFDADASHCEAFANEERRHGVACGAVVEALGGAADGIGLPEEVLPLHLDASTPREAVLRNVISVACLHETVAVALIAAELRSMPPGALRRLLTRIWADEIGHARFGWRLLSAHEPTLTAAERVGISRYLRVAWEHLDEHELTHLPDSSEFAGDDSAAELGLCDGREARSLFFRVRDHVLRPRLQQFRSLAI